MAEIILELFQSINKHHFQVHFDHRQSYKKFEIFYPKSWANPFGKNPRWRLIKFDMFIFCQNHFDFTLKHQQTSFSGPI